VGLPPIPYLIALATAANVGSVATIVGNPQNALIGVRSGIPLLSFVSALWPVAIAGLVVDGLLLSWIYRDRVSAAPLVLPPPRAAQAVEPWMLAAGMMAGAGMLVAMALGVRPAAASMSAAAAVILAGAARPRDALREVDWALLLFFSGLFVVMRGVADAGLADRVVTGIAGPIGEGGAAGLARLGLAVTVLSQAVSNVPAVMLFLPSLSGLSPDSAKDAWLVLAMASTLAGNLTILASVANVIVFETARRDGVEVGFLEYLKVGAPLTALTSLLGWALLAVR
jgi:Na+/H+ antiporter NhaD/arsenite permease-like protein